MTGPTNRPFQLLHQYLLLDFEKALLQPVYDSLKGLCPLLYIGRRILHRQEGLEVLGQVGWQTSLYVLYCSTSSPFYEYVPVL